MTQRIALVTGANRGIGLEISRQLARRDIQVVLTGRDVNKARSAADQLAGEGLPVTAHQLDVTDRESIGRLYDFVERSFGRLDILVNNAGTAIGPAPVVQMAEEAWSRTLEINATGTFLCSKYGLPLLIEGGRGGRIINISSLAAERPKPFVSAYAASKAAVVAFSRSLAQEVAEFGITVNAVLPGDVDTALKQWGLQL